MADKRILVKMESTIGAFVRAYFPDEAKYFNVVWSAVSPYLAQPEHRFADNVGRSPNGGLAFVGRTGALARRSLDVIAAIADSVQDLSGTPQPSREAVEASILRTARALQTEKYVLDATVLLVMRILSTDQPEGVCPAEGSTTGSIAQLERQPSAGDAGRQTVPPSVGAAASLDRILREVERLKTVKRSDPFQSIIGRSRAILGVISEIGKATTTDATALVTGETGVGKEIVARSIHSFSSRSRGEFVEAGVAGLRDPTLVASRLFGYKKGAFTGATTDMRGVFDEAHRGTLFLDEVGDLHPACQVMLLRALQENAILPVGATQTSPVDVRVIAATNRDLGECISEGTFREDLFFRLYVYLVRVPPLRERKEDISLLVEHFADAACRECGRPGVSFSDEAMRKLYLHDWPGNVRELQNCVKRAILSAGGTTVDAKDITFAELPREQAIGSREDREKDTLLEALKSSRTVKEAYEKLKMPKATFYEKLKKHGLESRALLEP